MNPPSAFGKMKSSSPSRSVWPYHSHSAVTASSGTTNCCISPSAVVFVYGRRTPRYTVSLMVNVLFSESKHHRPFESTGSERFEDRLAPQGWRGCEQHRELGPGALHLERPKDLLKAVNHPVRSELASRIHVFAGSVRHCQQSAPDAAFVHRLPRDAQSARHLTGCESSPAAGQQIPLDGGSPRHRLEERIHGGQIDTRRSQVRQQ